MKRSRVAASLAAAFAAAAALALAAPATADTIVYEFAGLRGPATLCAWFDDNINDRSEDALARQVDLLYNRVALPPGVPVTITGTATNARGSQLVQFDVDRALVCTGAETVHPPALPSPSP